MSHFVEKLQKLFKRVEKRPVRENTNGFDCVYRVVLGGRFVVDVFHVEPGSLFFGHFLFWIAFIKRHCRAVYLICIRNCTYKLQLQSQYIYTFSAASETVRTNVENTGFGVDACMGHHSRVAPIGRQNNGTESGIGKWALSSCGYRAWMPSN